MKQQQQQSHKIECFILKRCKELSFVGTGDDVPVITDSEGKILIGVNKTTGQLIADIDTAPIESVIDASTALKDHNLGQRKQTGGTVTAV